MPTDRLAPGIYRHGAGWQARVKVRGVVAVAQFDKATGLREMQAWQRTARAQLELSVAKVRRGTFASDAKLYLESVAAMATIDDRRRHIEAWVRVFGSRRRDTIKSVEIRRVRDQLLTQPRTVVKRVKAKDGGWTETTVEMPPYAPNTVNNRLSALSHLFAVLDAGRNLPNPVSEVEDVPLEDVPPRAIPYPLIAAILDALPDRGRAEKAGDKRPAVSQTKARLRVIAYTGIPHATLGRLTPADVNLDGAWVRLPGRRKGKGAKGRVVPLTPMAVDAFKALDAAGAWGKFSRSSMWKTFQRACKALNLPEHIRVYDLRHSYATALLLASGDLQSTGHALGHQSSDTTLRYTRAAVDPRLAEAVRRLALDASHGKP